MFLFELPALDFLHNEEQRIARNIRRLTDRDSQPEDREAASQWLAQNGSRAAILGMLQRFEIALEHQMKDQGEKEQVYSRLAAMGAEKVAEPTRVWLRQCRQFAMPLKLLADLAGSEAAEAMVRELLDIELKKDDFKPDKKKGLLVWLAEHKSSEQAADAAVPFLKDFDEGVRYAASEVCIAHGGDRAGEMLSVVLLNDKEESGRLKVRIAEACAAKGWRMPPAVEGALPKGFRAKDGRVYAG